jgi:hypothetical protein
MITRVSSVIRPGGAPGSSVRLEFAGPQLYARALASTGPAYEATQNIGEAEFHRAAVEPAQGQLRDGLPVRAGINVVGYLARKPEGAQRA